MNIINTPLSIKYNFPEHSACTPPKEADKYVKIAEAGKKCFEALKVNKARITTLTRTTALALTGLAAAAVFSSASPALLATAVLLTFVVSCSMHWKLTKNIKNLNIDKNLFYDNAMEMYFEIGKKIRINLSQILEDKIEELSNKNGYTIKEDVTLREQLKADLENWIEDFRFIHGFDQIYQFVWNEKLAAKDTLEYSKVELFNTSFIKLHAEWDVEKFTGIINSLFENLNNNITQVVDVTELINKINSIKLIKFKHVRWDPALGNKSL